MPSAFRWLLRFGLETLLRAPAIIVRVLAAILIVWTCLLALPGSASYFPAPAWQWGWVAFDATLAGALFALAHRWRQPLADIVATVVTADAVATFIQAIAFDLPRRTGLVDVAVIVVAMAAPSIAAILLWSARSHR